MKDKHIEEFSNNSIANLKELELSGNNIKIFDGELNNLDNLEYLNMSWGNLTSFVNNNLPKLDSVAFGSAFEDYEMFSNNSLPLADYCPDFNSVAEFNNNYLPSVKYIKIKNAPQMSEFKNNTLSSVTSFELSNSLIESIDNLDTFTKLKKFYLSNTNFQSFRDFSFPSLT